MIFTLIGKVRSKSVNRNGEISSEIEIERDSSFSDHLWIKKDLHLGDRITIELNDGRSND